MLGSVCRLPFTVSVSARSPHKTLQDLIVAVKAKGDKASYGTTAPTGQVAGAMMKDFLKLEIVEVPYRTAADSVNDLDSGAIDYIMYDPIFAMPRHREGKIRVLAVTSKDRMTTAPDIPTMSESGVPGIDVMGWWGVAVPLGVPEPIKDKIGKAFLQMAELPATKKWLADFGGDPWVVGAAEAQKQMMQDIDDWAALCEDRAHRAERLIRKRRYWRRAEKQSRLFSQTAGANLSEIRPDQQVQHSDCAARDTTGLAGVIVAAIRDRSVRSDCGST